jgi:hypothetical protein
MSETKQPDSLDKEKKSVLGKVHLNIGGRLFTTSDATLESSGYFRTLLEDKSFGVDPNDPLFIDRDGDLFSLVLNCMRNGGKLPAEPNLDILNELNYFMVEIYNPYSIKNFEKKYGKDLKSFYGKEFDRMMNVLGTILKTIETTEERHITIFPSHRGGFNNLYILYLQCGPALYDLEPLFRGFASDGGLAMSRFHNEYLLPTLTYFGWKYFGGTEERKIMYR